MLRLRISELDVAGLPAGFKHEELPAERRGLRPRYSHQIHFDVQALRALCTEFKDLNPKPKPSTQDL